MHNSQSIDYITHKNPTYTYMFYSFLLFKKKLKNDIRDVPQF